VRAEEVVCWPLGRKSFCMEKGEWLEMSERHVRDDCNSRKVLSDLEFLVVNSDL
jgi:hypothetical protein